MSITLNTLVNMNKKTDVHFVPASIEHNGEAKVKEYFKSNMHAKDNDSELKSSFRGRPLVGNEITLPTGYKGLVVKEKRTACSDHQDRQLTAEKTFNRFTNWNLDTISSSNDSIVKALKWIELANVMHEIIDVDEMH